MNVDLTAAIVICTRNRPVVLRECLEAIARLEPAPDEVIVVDNTAGDAETESSARELGARYSVSPLPGLSRARNRGLVECNSDIVVYLDDDCVPDKSWLEFLLQPFSDPDVAVVTGEVVTSLPPSCDNTSKEPRFYSNKDPKWFEIASFGGVGLGGNMALRKSTCSGWTVFDERLGRGAAIEGGEESHAFATLLSRGHVAVHVPAAVVSHPSKPVDIELEAARAFAYWLLMFFDFPGHRFELVQFLLRRLRHQPLTWQRSSPDLGPIITSGWRVQLKGALAGMALYVRARKSKDQ